LRRAILRSPRLLAVKQDPLGAGGRRVRDDGNTGGLCLDADRSGTTNGIPLVLWTCNGQNNQKRTRT
jgi:hypothetical protein